MKKKSIKILVSSLLVILWMGVIFCFSDMDAYQSSTKSKGAITHVITATVATTNKMGITNKHPSEERVNQLVDVLNYPLRKCMHASIYFGLMLLLLNVFKMGDMELKKAMLFSFIICFLYSCGDEYHQLFVGRTGQFRDVLIDMLGASIGMIFYLSCYQLLKWKKKHTVSQKVCHFGIN